MAREPLPLAVLSALGAGAIASAVGTLVIWAPSPVLPFTFGGVAGFGGFVGMVAASAVAMRAGGVLALAAYVGIVALRLGASLPGQRQLCELAIGAAFQAQCTFQGWVSARWEEALAIAIGVLATRAITTSIDKANTTLRVVGIVAVVGAIAPIAALARAMSYSFPSFSDEDTLTSIGIFAAASFIGAVIAGAVLGRATHRIALGAAAVALVIPSPWLVSLRLALLNPPPPFVPATPVIAFYLALATPPVAVLVFVVALLATRLAVRAR